MSALAPEVLERIEVAEKRWPGFAVERERFVEHLVAVAREQEEAPERLHVEDLYLAFACREGIDAAISVFEREFARDVAVALQRVDARGISDDDLRQALREKLFTAAGGAPRIAEYKGRGKLRNWVRVTMLRMRIDAERARKVEPAHPSPQEADFGRMPLFDSDPELRHLKEYYRKAFKDALSQAFGKLEPRQRTLLRQRHVDNLTTPQLAALYDVHRATLKRWLASAREQLLRDTKDVMREQLGVESKEFDSVVRLIESNFDVSVSRLLGGGTKE